MLVCPDTAERYRSQKREKKAGDAGLDHIHRYSCLRCGPEALESGLRAASARKSLQVSWRHLEDRSQCADIVGFFFYFSSHSSTISYNRNLLGKEPDATIGPWRRSDGLQLGLMSGEKLEKLILFKSGNQLACQVAWRGGLYIDFELKSAQTLKITANGIKPNMHCNP